MLIHGRYRNAEYMTDPERAGGRVRPCGSYRVANSVSARCIQLLCHPRSTHLSSRFYGDPEHEISRWFWALSDLAYDALWILGPNRELGARPSMGVGLTY